MKRLFFVLMLFSLLIFANVSFAETLIVDNFDSYTAGSPPGDSWILNTNLVNILVNNTVSNSPNNSVSIQKTSLIGSGGFEHSHTPITGQITYEAFLRSNTNQRETVVMFAAGTGGGGRGPWISFGGIAGYLAYYDGSWHNIATINANQWYHIKIVANVPTNTFDIYVDDMTTPVIIGANFWDSGSVTSLTTLGFAVYYALNPPSVDDIAYVDNVSAYTPSSIPTMNEWGMIIFMALAGMGAVFYLRRSKRAES